METIQTWQEMRIKSENDSTEVYFAEEENLVTDFVPSEMACFANSPGRMRRTEVWISREEIVDFLEYDASFDASVAMRSKISLTNELRIAIALFEIPVSG